MALITIILGLMLERFLGALEDYRRFDWFERYSAWWQNMSRQNPLLDGWIGAAGTVLSVVLLIAFVEYQVTEWFSLAGFAFSFIVFVFCLGPKSFYLHVKEYCNAMSAGNETSAKWYAEQLLGRELTAAEQEHMSRSMVHALYVVAHDRLFAVIFWFVLFGPAGAVFYRLTRMISVTAQGNSDFATSARSIYHWASWPTARLTAVSYALTGDFVAGIARLKDVSGIESSIASDANEFLLIAAGIGASGYEVEKIDADKVASTLALLRRTGIFVIGLIALATLAGWVS